MLPGRLQGRCAGSAQFHELPVLPTTVPRASTRLAAATRNAMLSPAVAGTPGARASWRPTRDNSTVCQAAATMSLDAPAAQTAVRPMKVLIAGAGIGGLVLAVALLKRGFEVQIFERDMTAIRGEGKYRGPIQVRGWRRRPGDPAAACWPPAPTSRRPPPVAGRARPDRPSRVPHAPPVRAPQVQSNALAALEAIDEAVAGEVMREGCITGDRINGMCDGVTGDWCAPALLLARPLHPEPPCRPRPTSSQPAHHQPQTRLGAQVRQVRHLPPGSRPRHACHSRHRPLHAAADAGQGGGALRARCAALAEPAPRVGQGGAGPGATGSPCAASSAGGSAGAPLLLGTHRGPREPCSRCSRAGWRWPKLLIPAAGASSHHDSTAQAPGVPP
jgi:hypothetical protein